ncbi:ABC-2 family transporter protein [Streptomyces sp. NBRC 109706]|uniref:ABC transporter permease n=1 Tax=Streptomyces sp. NBRC 109706 TaxID=1550035 RepID=UPI000A850301|nr:ABC-2 family transporter protein [Streptomyces sp. NBRC 109706]
MRPRAPGVRMRPYVSIARATVRTTLAYKLQFFLGLLGTVFQFAALLAVWRVLMGSGVEVGFGWPEMRAYLLVTFACGVLVSALTDFRMSFRIRSGLVSLDLVKPVDYQRARLAEALGGVAVETGLITLVCATTVVLSGGIPAPGAAQAVLFLVSMALVVPLKFALVYTTGLACFWTKSFLGVHWARLAITGLLSGAMIPISLLPRYLDVIARWSPFPGMASTPALIFVGEATGGEALRLIALQLLWVVVLWAGARLVWHRALRRLTIQGG